MVRFHHTHHWRVALLLLTAGCAVAQGPIQIQELTGATSSRLLRYDANGMARMGVGAPWWSGDFDSASWTNGVAGLGFGSGDDATDLQQTMAGRAVSLYTRHVFSVTGGQAGSGDALRFTIDYDDGFIAYLNGREVARKNMGPAGAFAYHDQPAYNLHLAGVPESFLPGVASNWLVAGENTLAIHVANVSVGDPTLTLIPELVLESAPETTLVATDARYDYFVGVVEPSGGEYDLTVLPPHEVYSPPWTQRWFDDGGWLSGPGGIGYGDGDDATVTNIAGVAMSIYLRQLFAVTPAQAASLSNIVLQVDYDDGFAAYLNGVEIARRGLGAAGSFVPHTAAATGHEAGTPEGIPCGIAAGILNTGTNVLAIQVHNTSLFSSDLTLIADLLLEDGGSQLLLSHSDPWRFFVGTEDPSPDYEDPGDPPEVDFHDWVELLNTTNVPVSLSGWALTDDKDEPTKWLFPDRVLQPGERLLIYCSGYDRVALDAPLHANFQLASDGEYLAVMNATGGVSDALSTMARYSWFHSYGRSGTNWVYFDEPTPGAPNAGPTRQGLLPACEVSHPPGFYDTWIDLVMTQRVAGAEIRYTVDGSEPSEYHGLLYTVPIQVQSSMVVRCRAVAADWVTSPVVTRTYMIGVPAAERLLPALFLTGDAESTLYKPNGVTSIVGGNWDAGGVWQAEGPDDYNIPVNRGRAYERPASIEFVYPNGGGWVQAECGLRIAGSNWSRPRYQLQDLEGWWTADNKTQKAQFNLFFRDVYGGRDLDAALFAESEIDAYRSVRLRSGHNDHINPFVRDELMRRLFRDMGRPGPVGMLAGLFVNARFKCYYNPTERIDEHFLQEAHNSSDEWDIVNHGGLTEGDLDAWNRMMDFTDAANASVLSNYQAMATMLDVEGLIDYLLVNMNAATWDWPQNNWYAARPRRADGRFAFYVWDAEGAFGNNNPKTFNSFADAQGSLPSYAPVGRLYWWLAQSAEFKLLFADRIYAQFFGGGALEESHVTARFSELKTELDPMMQYYRGYPVSTSVLSWLDGRREILFGQFRDNGVWPSVMPPAMSPASGTVTNGTRVALSHTNSSGTIYYTLDGSDPRAPGGVAVGTPYSGEIVIDRTTRIKARVVDGGEWSAMARELYVVEAPGLRISEIMYHPIDEALEFIELWNNGPDPVSLLDMAFVEGITFTFPQLTLAPDAYAVVVLDLAAFGAAYDTNSMIVVGQYGGKLSNGGETVRLEDAAGGRVQAVSYSDRWHLPTDGYGHSLTLSEQWEFGDDDRASGWRASAAKGGSPGAADPLPLQPALRVNEILTHTDWPQTDSVELFNPAATNVSLAGWSLTDDPDQLAKWPFPASALIPGRGTFVVYEDNDGDPLNNAGLPPEFFGSAFAISSRGEEIYLVSPEISYVHGFAFGAAANGVSFGYHLTSENEVHYPAQAQVTLGASNSLPRVGPLVISEIMYHPPAGGTEFLELLNTGGAPLPLYESTVPTNTWRVNGIDFQFPEGVTLATDERILLIPSTATTTLFRAEYAVPAGIRIWPYAGALDNSGERLTVQRPDVPDPDGIPWIVVESVQYNDRTPWPTAADGEGASIERRLPGAYADDPASWAVGLDHLPTPGRPPQPFAIVAPASGGHWVTPFTLPVTVNVDLQYVEGEVDRVEFLTNGVLFATDSSYPYESILSYAGATGTVVLASRLMDAARTWVAEPVSLSVHAAYPTGVSPPLVVAGPDVAHVLLAAALDRNDWPVDVVSGTWSQVAGPGVVSFGDPSGTLTEATFSTTGVYTVAWTVDWGTGSSSALVTIRFGDAATPHLVPYREAFERFAAGSELVQVDGWRGVEATAATIVTGTPVSVSFPILDAEHRQVLAVEGGVTSVYHNVAPNGMHWFDLLVAPELHEEEALPEVGPDVQFGLLFDQERHPAIWGETSGGSNGWIVLPDVTLATSGWIRVTVQLDYTQQTVPRTQFRLWLDGQPVTHPATWFMSAVSNATAFSSLSVSGVASLDDLAIGDYNRLTHRRITATFGEGGAIAPAAEILVPISNTADFVVSPEPYYHVVWVDVDGVLRTASVSQVSFTNVIAEHALHATFDANLAAFGVPEWWLAQANSAWSTNFDLHASTDSDGDGHAGWEEYVTGSNPDDINSVLRVSIQPGPAMPLVSFVARSGADIGVPRWYRLEEVDAMGSTNWQAVSGLPDFLGQDQKVIHSELNGAPIRFYRVCVWLQE